MDYTEYLSNDGIKKGKLGAYKTHIIKNIEKIGQKKLVIIGSGEEYDVLMQALKQLRMKNVKVRYRIPCDGFRGRGLRNGGHQVHQRT